MIEIVIAAFLLFIITIFCFVRYRVIKNNTIPRGTINITKTPEGTYLSLEAYDDPVNFENCDTVTFNVKVIHAVR